MAKQILISGIQPTGKLHIGNYLGALKNFVELQDSGKYDCYFFIADLHSLTENFDPKDKTEQIKELILDYLAIGLDPKKSTIFIQSQVPESTELAWILNTITPFGELGRMTQFKEKAEYQKENVIAGLFNYPILMAADILLYRVGVVPVGDDQLQHLELSRTLARRFNARFGKTFVEPKPLLTNVPRLMSLDDPKKKMSKSRPAGCLFLEDSPEEIHGKIKGAVTDSGNDVRYDEKNKPAISNLLKIYSEMSGVEIKDTEKEFKAKGYGEFMKSLAKVVVDHLKPFTEKKDKLRKESKKVKEILEQGREKAWSVAKLTMKDVRAKIGLL